MQEGVVCVIIVSYDYWLLFTYHYSARCFSINMPKSRDIQAKIPLPQAIWNEFWTVGENAFFSECEAKQAFEEYI